MAVIRLILLVAVLGGLTLLLAQNWSPPLSLVFLGMRTQALPLSLWILFSATAGGFTSILITTLFKLSNLFPGQQPKISSPSPSAATSRPGKANRREEPTPPPKSPPPPASKTNYTTSQEFDDWDTSRTQNDDWDFEEESEEQPTPKTSKRGKAPKTDSRSGSVYSYSSQEPKNTAVGKTESVYDADYRVIIPPYKPPTTNQADEDDWDFFDDNDSEDEDERPRR